MLPSWGMQKEHLCWQRQHSRWVRMSWALQVRVRVQLVHLLPEWELLPALQELWWAQHIVSLSLFLSLFLSLSLFQICHIYFEQGHLLHFKTTRPLVLVCKFFSSVPKNSRSIYIFVRTSTHDTFPDWGGSQNFIWCQIFTMASSNVKMSRIKKWFSIKLLFSISCPRPLFGSVNS